MRTITTALVLAGLLALGGLCPLHSADDQGAIFNGKDLDGWEGLTQYWSVKDGAIVGTAGAEKVPFNTFLWTKKRYKDFELKCYVRLMDGQGNSGVQIRSEVLNQQQLSAKGPQCDIGQQFWGSLYGENFGGMMKAAPVDVVKKALKPADFNDYYIKCVGKHVTIKLNGETTVDDDFEKMPEDGRIGLQLHGGHVMEVTFKNFEFKDLSGK
jgi:hypothetical protein